MELPVILKRQKNAIKEAAITLFLSSPINKPDRFKEIIKDPDLNSFFHSYENIGEVTFNFAHVKGNISNKGHVYNDAGFKLLRFVEGKPEFVLQGINDKKRNYFSFHELNYVRWADFLDSYKKILKTIEKIHTEIFLTGLSLHYIDEFIWCEETPIDLTRIIEAKDYFPQNFMKSKSGYLVNTREIENAGVNKIFDRIELLLTSDISKNIVISHNQNVLFDNLVELKKAEAKEDIIQNFNLLHKNNKNFLGSILLPEVKKLIGLTEN